MKKFVVLLIPLLAASCSIDLLGFIGTTDVRQTFQRQPDPAGADADRSGVEFSIVRHLGTNTFYHGSNENSQP
jgi:hypothetical protein